MLTSTIWCCWIGVLQSGLSGPLDPILATLVGFNTFEEANEGITSIYKVWILTPISAAVEWQALDFVLLPQSRVPSLL